MATKCGRRLSPHVAEAYTPRAMRQFVESSLSRLGLERIDLVQLHCPPTAVYYRPEVFELFERLRFPETPLHLAALRFVLDTPGVTTVIPGASRPEQVDDNLRVTELAPLTAAQRRGVTEIYDGPIRRHVHAQW